jgi:hypothetical protein
LALHVVRLFEDGSKFCYFLFTDGVSFKPQRGLTVSGPENGERAFHYGLGNGHFRVMLPEVLNDLGYGNAVFVATFAGFIIRGDDQPGSNETPELFPAFLFFGSSSGSLCVLHGSL